MRPPKTSSPPDTPGDVLLDAAARLERSGRCRGTYADGRGRHCAVAALHLAASGGYSATYARLSVAERGLAHRAAQLLGEHLRVRSVIDWNDTEPDDAVVLAALLAAAGRPERRSGPGELSWNR